MKGIFRFVDIHSNVTTGVTQQAYGCSAWNERGKPPVRNVWCDVV